jgi:hypothetical protein
MRGWLFIVLVSACASQQKLPPGNDLEMPKEDPGEANTVNQSKMPNASQELAKAFEPPPTPGPRPSNVPAPAPKDDMASVREAFAQEMGQAKSAVAAGQWADANPLLESLEKDGTRLGPAELQSVLELAERAFSAQKEWRGARKASERWLNACGPDRADWCRARALAALTRLSGQKTPEAGLAKNFVLLVRSADECLYQSEAAARAKAPMPGCLEGALATYRGHGDRLMVARGQFAKALTAAADSKSKGHAADLYEHAANACQEQRCASVRRRALKLAGWSILEEDVHRAAKLMLEEMGLAATMLPDDKRRYARTPEVEKVCAILDARDGAGTCRKLEKTVVGDYTFKDYSVLKAGVGLKADTVREVNEHFGVTLQECLAQEAERLKPPAYETYQVEWMVLNDGRVDQVHMARRDQDETPLAECLRAQFGVWRYPRYDGEAQHVAQSFTVSARERTVR